MKAEGEPTRAVAEELVVALDRITRGVRSHRQTIATSLGLTPLQLELIRTLADAPPPRPTPGDLAVELGVSQPTITDSIGALERKGLVVRSVDPLDRRRTIMGMTDAGNDLLAKAYRAEDPLRRVFESLDQADQASLLQAMVVTIGALLEAGVIQIARTCHTCRFFEPHAESTPRCGLLDLPLLPSDLRVNCPEHEAAQAG